MNVAAVRVSLVYEQQTFYSPNFGEVLARLHPGKRASRAILFAAIGSPLCARRVHLFPIAAQVAFDGNEVLGRIDRRRDGIGTQSQILLKLCLQVWLPVGFLFWPSRNHRNRVVRTLSSAVSAADAGLRIDVDLAHRKSP